MTTKKPILTVTQLNRYVKNYLESELGLVQVEGEISNLSKPSSGHLYFTLKDANAQIRCVFFKNRHLPGSKEQVTDGQHIIATGSLSLYEARGDYQLIITQVSSAGLGALYQKFEALKNKLAAEGLFESQRKKPIPSIPKTIGLITSTSGAAIQDILSTLARRFPLAEVLIYPSEVQGVSAPKQLIKALQHANEVPRCDVIILARGGGSIEDLWAFNDEQLAREMILSTIPIVTGIGHETDFTIADFVADYRAETPTAAAAVVTPDCRDLINFLDHLVMKLHSVIARKFQMAQLILKQLKSKIASLRQGILTYWQTVDYLEKNLFSVITQILEKRRYQLQVLYTQLQAKNPQIRLEQTQVQLNQLIHQLKQHIQQQLNLSQFKMQTLLSTLHAVSPLATLDRGYAIAKVNKKVLFNSQQVSLGDTLELRLARGSLACKVTQIKEVNYDH